MKNLWKAVDGLKPAILMVVVRIGQSAVTIMFKLAIVDGMSMRVATAYRLIFATAATVPLALISERKSLPNFSWRVLFLAFLSGLFGGSLFQNIFYESVALTSATFSSAIYNLVPITTFIMAICCGYENLTWKTAAGKAKVLGTLVGIGGAMLLTFFKGLEINIWPFKIDLLHSHHLQNSGSGFSWLGVLCSIGSCFAFSSWLIIQAKMNEEYPFHLSSTALMSFMGAIQSTIFALIFEKDWTQWKLGWNIRLLAVAFGGIVVAGIMTIAIAWCVTKRGPVYASAFNPLGLALVAIASSLMLNEQLYIGSVLGGVLIVIGLYMVLWGKSKETRKTTQAETMAIKSEVVEINIGMSTRIHDKGDHGICSDINNTSNVTNKNDSSRNEHEPLDIHIKNGTEEEIVSWNPSDAQNHSSK